MLNSKIVRKGEFVNALFLHNDLVPCRRYRFIYHASFFSDRHASSFHSNIYLLVFLILLSDQFFTSLPSNRPKHLSSQDSSPSSFSIIIPIFEKPRHSSIYPFSVTVFLPLQRQTPEHGAIRALYCKTGEGRKPPEKKKEKKNSCCSLRSIGWALSGRGSIMSIEGKYVCMYPVTGFWEIKQTN